MQQIDRMQIFFYRLSMVEYENKKLILEKNRLKMENDYLKNNLRRFCHEQTYQQMMGSLQLNSFPLTTVPVQEANLLPSIKSKFNKK